MNPLEEQSRQEIWKMFNQISPYYDWINRIFSFGADIYWRRQFVRYLPKQAGLRLLDLATGTGEQLIAIIKKAKQVQKGLGLDVSREMIRIAQRKIQGKPYAHRITLMEGDATRLSLPENAVDCITMSFGIRNVTGVDKCLNECFRVLAPNGHLMILEFSIPKNAWIRRIYFFYLRHVLSILAGWISHSPSAYRYLYQTIHTFPCGGAFCQRLKQAGFERVRAHPLTFGIVTIYTGKKVR